MIRNGHAVCLITQVLKKKQRLGVTRENNGFIVAGYPNFFKALGKAYEGDVNNAELIKDLLGRSHLRCSAVDDK